MFFFGFGNSAPEPKVIDYITISTTGNAIDFGDMSGDTTFYGGVMGVNRTRAIYAGGYVPNNAPTYSTNIIQFVDVSSTGNSQDFGDLTAITTYNPSGVSNNTRAIRCGGATTPTSSINVLDYVTIASTGNANDFGDLYFGTRESGGCNSPTRGIVKGGSPTHSNVIQFITISTQGDSADFGDTTVAASRGLGSGSNAVRGVLHLGYTPTVLNTVDFITIATLGNAQDFGDLTEARFQAGGAASTTRLVVMGGSTPSVVDTMDYAQIMTTGNFIDFGELVGSDRAQTGGCSNGHGGLG